MNVPTNTPGFRAGDWLIISGQTGRTGERLAEGGFVPQLQQALRNMASILEEHGLDLNAVAKVNVYLADISDRDVMNEVYLDFFKGHRPARTTVGVSGLARGALVEVEAWAFCGPAGRASHEPVPPLSRKTPLGE